MSHTDTPFGHSSAIGPLWYAVGRALEPSPADRPTAAKIAKDLLGVAELLSRPDPLPLMGVEPVELSVQSGVFGASGTSGASGTGTSVAAAPAQQSGKRMPSPVRPSQQNRAARRRANWRLRMKSWPGGIGRRKHSQPVRGTVAVWIGSQPHRRVRHCLSRCRKCRSCRASRPTICPAGAGPVCSCRWPWC